MEEQFLTDFMDSGSSTCMDGCPKTLIVTPLFAARGAYRGNEDDFVARGGGIRNGY